MNNNRISVKKIINIMMIMMLIIGWLFIALFKFPNQNLSLNILCEENVITVEFSYDEMKYQRDDIRYVEIEDTSLEKIQYIEICRFFKSVPIGKISSSQLWEYVDVTENEISFNDIFFDKLCTYSKSFLLERIFFSELYLAIIVLTWIIINSIYDVCILGKKDNHHLIYELSKFFENLIKYRSYIVYAAKADLKAEVANSYLNRLWWVLEPFCNMIVYVVVFGQILGGDIEKYSTFIFSSLLMWNYFNHVIIYSVKCVRNNRDIVTKIYVPKYVLLLTNMVLNFIKLLFSMLILIIMLVMFKVSIGFAVLWVIPAYVLMLILSFAFGMILLHYGVFVDDLAYAVGILMTLLMFLSGIFYDVTTSLFEPLNHIMMCCNPIIIFLTAMRNALIYNKIMYIPLVFLWTFIGVIISYLGIHIVNKNENGYVKVI